MLRFFIFVATLLLLQSAIAHDEESQASSHVFAKNLGQWNNKVLYKAEVGEATVFFEERSFHYQLISRPDHHSHVHSNKKSSKDKLITKGHNFKSIFLNSNSDVKHQSYDPSEAYFNYFIGNDKSKWKGGVRKYEKLKYENLYNGIDLIAYTENSFLKYDCHIAPQTNPEQIQIEYQGVDLPTLRNGNLIITHSLGELIEEKPYAYQVINNEKVEVPCKYYINDAGIVSFQFPNGYDESIELIIDPVLVFSTYSGSNTSNFGMSATFDRLGNGYMGGTVFATGYDTTLGAFQTNYGFGPADIAISKLNPTGTSLIYSTLLGGTGSETVHSMVVDDSLNLIIFGVSSSTNFPTTSNCYDSTKETSVSINLSNGYSQNFFRGADIIVTKFNETGTDLIGSTFFGGDETDGLNIDPVNAGLYEDKLVYNYGDPFRGEVIVDSSGNIYIGSSTHSQLLDFARNSLTGEQDGIIAKFNPDLTQLQWCRYLGGSDYDAIYSLKVIDGNKILVGGGTESFTNFPTTTNVYQDTSSGGVADGFIAIISEDGNTLEHSTYIGTRNYDQVYFIEFDRFNNIYGYGQSGGGEFPIVNSVEADTGAGQFFIKLDSNLEKVSYSHTFGDGVGTGQINISPTAFLVDKCLNIYASGWGKSVNFINDGTKILTNNMPITPNTALRTTTDLNGEDFYLYVVSAREVESGKKDSLVYGSFFGGTFTGDHVDGGTSRFDKNGVIYQSVCASCQSSLDDFTTSSDAYSREDQSPGNGCNNALFKVDFEILINADFTISQDEFCLSDMGTDSVVITNNSANSDVTTWYFSGDTIVSSFEDTTIFITTPGVYEIRQIVFDSICAVDDFKTLQIIARPDNINLLTSRDTIICYQDSAEVTAFSNGFANQFTWSSSLDFSNPLAITSDSILKIDLNQGVNKVYVLAENSVTNACPKIDSAVVEYIQVDFGVTASVDTICENSFAEFNSTQINVDRFKWDFGNGITDSTNEDTSIRYNTPGDYIITIEYENFSCPTIDTFQVMLNVQESNLNFNNLRDTIFCGTGNFVVSKNSFGTANQYVWSNNRNLSDTLNSSIQDSTFIINQEDSSLYYIQISNGYCTKIDSILIQYIEYDLGLNSFIDSSCTPFSEELQTTIIGSDFFRINYGDGRFTTTDSTPIVDFQTEGLYVIELIGGNARCNISDTLSETIEIFQGVEIFVLNDTILCSGDTIDLIGNSNGTAKQFIWDTSPTFETPLNNPIDSFIQVTPTQSSIYYLKGQNVICEAVDTVSIEIEIVDVEVDDITSLCLEDTVQIDARIIDAPTPLTFEWSPNDSIDEGQGTSTILTSPLDDMTFQLISTSPRGCIDIDFIDVSVNTPAFTTAEIFIERDSIFRGESTLLSTNRNGSNLIYQWEPIEGMDNPSSPTPSLKVSESKPYKVTITDILTGCVVTATKELFVFEVNCDEPDIFVPSAFTPNSDLSNDILYVRGANLLEIEFQLFNRWGELVFETNDKNVGWDGKYKGRDVDPGVFAYQLKAICFDGQNYFTKGNITLIR